MQTRSSRPRRTTLFRRTIHLRRTTLLLGTLWLIGVSIAGFGSRLALPVAGSALVAGCILDMEEAPDSTLIQEEGDGCPPGPPI